MSDTLTGEFLEGLAKLGVQDQYADQFLRYRQELLDWNTRTNLTAITDPEEVLLKHFLDSLSLLLAYDQPRIRLLDIGSGAGFPCLSIVPLVVVSMVVLCCLRRATWQPNCSRENELLLLSGLFSRLMSW